MGLYEENVQRLAAFNREYHGKSIKHCDILGTTINFNRPAGITFCCSSTTRIYPGIEYDRETEFSKDAVTAGMIQLIEANQNGGPCCGCEHLVETRLTHDLCMGDFEIANIGLNFFGGCNSNCVYCGDYGPVQVYYEPLPLLKNYTNSGIEVAWGGGEPTLLPNLEEYIQYIHSRGWSQLFNTSGLICKECIIEALSDRNFTVQISVDSGTPETYRKVKGQNGYDRVWKTVKRYCDTGGNVIVKYIVFSYNSGKEEIDAFISNCLSAGVRRIVVSGEIDSNWHLGDHAWPFGEEEISGCVYLLEQAARHGIAAELSKGNFSTENYNKIINKLYAPILLGEQKNGSSFCI